VSPGQEQWTVGLIGTGFFDYTVPGATNVFSGTETQTLVSAVPEPSAFLLLGVGLGGLTLPAFRRTRRQT
jgi:hypothetical protein